MRQELSMFQNLKPILWILFQYQSAHILQTYKKCQAQESIQDLAIFHFKIKDGTSKPKNAFDYNSTKFESNRFKIESLYLKFILSCRLRSNFIMNFILSFRILVIEWCERFFMYCLNIKNAKFEDVNCVTYEFWDINNYVNTLIKLSMCY